MLAIPSATTLLVGLLALPSAVRAVFRDEVGHIDYHHQLLGLPQRETTFFHRPRKDDQGSLLYTLSDEGVLGAVNPGNGGVVWRQFLAGNSNNETAVRGGEGFARAGEGEGWVASAYGGEVHAWDAVTGRNKFWARFPGRVKDLEVMEMTESQRKDVLVLFEEEEKGETVLRRLNAADGSVVWEFREAIKDVPLQVSTNVEKVFVVFLKGTKGAYSLKVTTLDTLTGKRLDELVIGTKANLNDEEDIMLVGANSAAPIVAWTDAEHTTLRVNVLGLKTSQEFPLVDGAVSVEIHAPHLIQSQPHFLVHSRTATSNKGEVYHIDLKTGHVSKAYDLPLLPGKGAFATSSISANVYFTRITEDELILVSSQSHGVLGRWPLKNVDAKVSPVHAVSEVIRKAGADGNYAVRSAALTTDDEWALVRNGEVGWTRPEGLSGGVAATFAEIPESEELARSLEQEAHSNPIEAYIHRVKRHINDLQYLPAYLNNIPARLISSIAGTDVTSSTGKHSRDSFGFHKLVILATKRGMVYGLDIGNSGAVVWHKRAFQLPKAQKWDVKGIQVNESSGQVTILGANNDFVVLKTETGDVVSVKAPSPEATTQSTALVDTPVGMRLLRIGQKGKIGDLPIDQAPKQTVVTRGTDGELKGVTFIADGATAHESTSWIFSLPKDQRIVSVATRPSHDAIASIGRVLGDRTVKYKYLNPNTIVAAAIDDKAWTLTVYLLDTVSGQILSSAKYNGVDPTKSVECAMAENWFACSFFGQYTLRENSAQSLKGYQIVVSDLYESEEANDRGPLGDASSFSSLDPVDVPTGVALPSVVSQTYIMGGPISALQVSQTRQGITSRQLLAYLPESHGIMGIPRMLLEPRRPVGRDATPAEIEEGLFRYHPAIEIDPKSVITHERDVIGIKKIITSPAIVESTSLVFAYGVDIFGTRVTPSFLFDILGKGFNKVSLVGTVLALFVGVAMLAPMVRKKQINLRWSAPM
ncbi:hypothetical protein QBC40DRAFT_225146 [Triangularia verruculosa]|uniref:ER membrane protein complex subunit 1 n=1 Tax=Triangularia verruculosa TaxID=2587418 RepID=A0AAN6XHA7_9PEZI|nr:hypothetical protein QBC40DRAFT_225146 [Triangularia verruculosa]